MDLTSAHRGDGPSDPDLPGSSGTPYARPRQLDLLRARGIRLDKRLGQHFLADPGVPDRIARAVAALQPERVVELACGAGALSFALLEHDWPVHALELDQRMIDLMREETADPHFGGRFSVEHADLADTDFGRFLDGRRVVFAGNLPYQITSPVLFGLLPVLRSTEVAGAVVMVQAEVAQRLIAAPGGRTYGVLSVLLRAEIEIRRLFNVKPSCFLPPPEVDSTVVQLTRRAMPVELGPEGRALVKMLFRERRKQIGGLLRRALDLPESSVEALLGAVGLQRARRPESLTPEDFARLARALSAVRPDWAALLGTPADETDR